MAPNILQLQREVESLSDERLLQEAQMPNMFPAYLTQQEMVRREQERNAYQSRKMQQPGGTVHDRLIERAMSGIGSIPQQLSPEQEMFARQAMMDMSPEQMMQQQMMMQSPMPQPMADGGLVGYQHGGFHDPDPDPYNPYPASPIPLLRAINDWLARNRSNATTDYGGIASYTGTMGTVLPRPQPQDPDTEASGLGITRERAQMLEHDLRKQREWAASGELGISPERAALLIHQDVEEEPEGIASLIASMQAPVFGREAMDVSEYYEMTPEERRLLEFYGSRAQSLESRIDTEADTLSARANILSNVSRAMARGQVPTVSEPLRELQTAQRARREGIMDESRAMEMAALAQEAGLSRAEQEALMERAIIGEERDYQESLRESERQRFNQYVRMTQSDDPEVQAMGFYHLQKMGVTSRGDVTGNQRAELDAKALAYYNPEFIQNVMADVETDEQFESAVERVRNMLNLHYSSVGGAPPTLIDDVVSAMAQERSRR